MEGAGYAWKFQVLVNGQPLAETFGTKSAEWFWQDGGTVNITQPQTTLALHGLMVDGHCDAPIHDGLAGGSLTTRPRFAWRKEPSACRRAG